MKNPDFAKSKLNLSYPDVTDKTSRDCLQRVMRELPYIGDNGIIRELVFRKAENEKP